MLSDQSSGLAPLFVFLAVLLFAALGWCMLSSCLGQSLGDLWNAYVTGARSARASQPWRGRPGMLDGEYELEYRGRTRAA